MVENIVFLLELSRVHVPRAFVHPYVELDSGFLMVIEIIYVSINLTGWSTGGTN